jgi:hypothetical protein
VSLVDCVRFEFNGSQGLTDVLSLDSHFAEERFRLVPSPRGASPRRGTGPTRLVPSGNGGYLPARSRRREAGGGPRCP